MRTSPAKIILATVSNLRVVLIIVHYQLLLSECEDRNLIGEQGLIRGHEES